MKSSIRAKKVLQKWSVMLILLAVTAVLSAASGPPKASAPAAKAPAAHAAPAHAAQRNTITPRRSTPAGIPRGRVEQARIIEVLAGQVPTIAGREVTRPIAEPPAPTPIPKRAPIARCEWCEPWWRQRQPSPDGSRSRGCGCQSQRCKRRQSWCGRRQCRPSSAGGQQEVSLKVADPPQFVKMDRFAPSTATACTSSMGPTAAARLSARTTERASSTQDAMADTCSGPMSIAAVTPIIRAPTITMASTRPESIAATTTAESTTTATIRGLSTALVSTAGL